MQYARLVFNIYRKEAVAVSQWSYYLQHLLGSESSMFVPTDGTGQVRLFRTDQRSQIVAKTSDGYGAVMDVSDSPLPKIVKLHMSHSL